jgi:fructose-1,6-bisphosphatase/inositol monophosphatase family enzyme
VTRASVRATQADQEGQVQYTAIMSDGEQLDLPKILEYVRGLAKECGVRVLAGYRKDKNSLVFKGGEDDSQAPTPDIVTEVDKAVEEFLIEK